MFLLYNYAKIIYNWQIKYICTTYILDTVLEIRNVFKILQTKMYSFNSGLFKLLIN